MTRADSLSSIGVGPGATAPGPLRVATPRWRPRRLVAVVVPIVVLAAIAGLYIGSTRTGIGMTPDSVSYVEGARSLAAGDGYSRDIDVHGRQAIVDYPPLYSTMLAGLELLGVGVLAGARFLDAALLVGTALLVYLLVFRSTAGSRAAALLAASAFGLSLPILRLYGFALSESLFLFLVAAWALALDAYVRRRGRLALACVAVLGPAAVLTRYVGVAVPVASVVAIALFGPGRRRRRVRDAAVVSATGVTPALLWTLRNRRSGVETVFSPAVHRIPGSKFTDGVHVVASWMFPPPVPERARLWLLAGMVTAGAVAAVLVALQRPRRLRPSRLRNRAPGVLALAIFAVAYLGVVVFALTFVQAVGTFDTRYLAPVFLASVVLVAVCVARSRRVARCVGLAVLSVIVVAYAFDSLDGARGTPIRERGITASYFADSELIDVARAQHGRVLYSDRPETIFANTRLRTAEAMPKKYDQNTLESNPSFERELRRLGTEVRADRAVIVMWRAQPRPQFPSVDELAARVHGLAARSFPSGVVFFAASRGSPTG